MTVRDVSAGTLCAVVFACLALTSIASEASLEDGVSLFRGPATLVEVDNLESACSPQAADDDSDAIYSVTVDPTLSLLPSWTAESDQADALFGRSVASAGDVNGDGYDDVVVGAYRYSNGETDEGRAYLYLGSASGLSATPSWTAESDQAWALLGCSVASAGDVNGDGYDDIVVGASSYDNDEENEGRTYLYLGSASGLSVTPSWTAESDQAGAWFGDSVASAGDVNGDGYDDVVVGAYRYSNGETDEGRAYLYLGSASGLSATPSWTAESDQAGAWFGDSVASAGDVNGDGYDDIVIGMPLCDDSENNEGRAYLYLGSASGLSATPSWTSESDQAGAWFGYSVASAGDVNNDGYDDVVVGAPYYANGESREGRAYLYLGSASGLSATPSWTSEGDQALSAFGWSVMPAGDVNNDGYGDVVVGAPDYAYDETGEGHAYLYMGSASGLSATPSWTAEGNQAYAGFGYSVASAGDVDNDGYGDVVVGAPYYANGESREGRAYLYMDYNGLPTADAGANQTVTIGDVITFDGSASIDDSGSIENYTWVFAYGDEMRGLYGVSPTFTFDIAGTYVVTLTVEDAEGEMDTDTVTITVEEEEEDKDEKSFIESYGLALGIVIVLAILALVLFFTMKGRKGGMAPTSMEEASAGEPAVPSESPRPG